MQRTRATQGVRRQDLPVGDSNHDLAIASPDLVVEPAAAAELAPRNTSRHLDSLVVRVHLGTLLSAFQAL